MKSFAIKLFSLILISGLGILIYSNSFSCSFHLDDRSSIVENHSITNIYDLKAIWDFWPSRFITYLSLALNYHYSKLHVFTYHFFNLAVHLLTAILVWWLTLLTLSTPVIKGVALVQNKSSKKISHEPVGDGIAQHAKLNALLAGLIFVSHPVQTQAVTYIVQRATSMAALFYLASLCFYIQSRLLDRSSFSAKGCYAVSLIAAILAMFAKENAITLPLMILLYEFYFLNFRKDVRNGFGFNWKFTAPYLFTLLIIPLTMLFTKDVNFQEMHRTIEGASGITSGEYFLTQSRVIVTYLRLLFFPLNQNLDYDYLISESLFELPVLISFLFIGAILFGAVRAFSKYRLVSFSILWFFLTLLPESSFIPIKDVIFEHRLYLPLVGFSLFLVSAMYYLLGRRILMAMIIVLTMVITCNAFLTYQRNKVWKDDFTLWGDVVQKSPHKARGHYSLGKAYDLQGNADRAFLEYTKAIELKPDYADAYNNRGHLYSVQGDMEHALSDYDEAIQINPRDAIGYNDRGNIYLKQRQFTEAISDYDKAIEINPNYEEAYNNRGNAYTQEGNLSSAASDFEKAITIDSNSPQVYDNQGTAYFKQGQIAQAIDDFTKAIAIDPKDASFYSHRATSYAAQGNFSQAMSDFNQAIDIDSSDAQTYYNRGLIYDRGNNLTEAMSDFNKAIEINPKYAQAYTDRGLIYQKQGDFTKALIDYNKAIELDPQYKVAYNNRAVDYFQLKNYTNASADAQKAEELGYPVSQVLIRALTQAAALNAAPAGGAPNN